MTLEVSRTPDSTVSAGESLHSQLVTCEEFLRMPNLRHGSTTRHFRPPCTTRLDEMRSACSLLSKPAAFLAYGEQMHTNHVGVVTAGHLLDNSEANSVRLPQTDALVTDLHNVALVIQTADCAPIFLFDPQAQVIGMAHGGWKGTLARIAQRTVEAMVSLGASPQDMRAWIGPMARSCCYEVNNELITAFRDEFADMPAHLVHRERHLDLVEVNVHQLLLAGVPPQQVFRSGICTIHENDTFYSYRADHGTTGRILSLLLMLEE